MNKELLKGIVTVTIGAASYGVLATLVKLAYNEGYTTTDATVSQYSLGLLFMGVLVLFNRNARRNGSSRSKSGTSAGRHSVFKLIAGGTAFGLTGVFYYLSVRYIPVSICVVLLMQTIWMGIVLESILEKKLPGLDKCAAVAIIIFGTILATNAIGNKQELDIRGIVWGLAAALTYTITLFISNRIALAMHPQKKSFWILLGGTAIILIIGSSRLMGIDVSIFWKWGLLLALFGTILPPLLLNIGLPKTGIGLGSIIISIEIPVSVGMAYILLNEEVLAIQWIGIVLIIASIVLLNLGTLRKELKSFSGGQNPV